MPAQVYLFQTPTDSENGLRTYGSIPRRTRGRPGTRCTLNHRRFASTATGRSCPSRTARRSARSTPTADCNFAGGRQPADVQLPAPRIGIIYDLTGNGQDRLKSNYGMFWWNPGTGSSRAVNANAVDWYRRFAWTDTNSNRLCATPERKRRSIAQRGGLGSAILDPNLKEQRTREVATFFEHELMPNFAIHVGYVYRRIDNLQRDVNRTARCARTTCR